MDFITWWFDTHYIASTIFTPFLTWMWCLFYEPASLLRTVLAATWAIVNIGVWVK